LPVPATSIAAHYTFKSLGRGTVAGRECLAVALEPKDDYRYGYQLCADTATGLLLKAVPLDANNQPSGQFVFTQVEIGAAPERSYFKSAYAGKKSSMRFSPLPICCSLTGRSGSCLPGLAR
jgi:Negative regulator of sigma E activity